MDDLSITSPVKRVVFMKAARIGGSEAGNNWLGYIIDNAPGPAMLVEPTEATGKKYIRQKLDPMIAAMPRLREKMRGRQATFDKGFEGGQLNIANAKSAASLRAIDARYLMCDEVDAYDADVDNEGDPLELALKRTANFGDRAKQYIVSTPTIKDLSRIETYYEQGDQRRRFIPCPHCGEFQILKFANLKWDKGNPDSAAYYCEHCGAAIGDQHKAEMFELGEWRPTAMGDGITKSYRIDALYQSPGWYPAFADIAREWEQAQGKPKKLKVFVNTVLGETWEERGEAPDHERIYERREDYTRGKAPAGVLFITAGVDIQKDRIETYLWGWGRGDQCWLIDHIVDMGPTTQKEVWVSLDALLKHKTEHETGNDLPLTRICVDMQYETQQVYRWARGKDPQRVMVVRGVDKMQMALGTPQAADVSQDGRRIARGIRYWPVGSSFLKGDLYGRLRLPSPVDGEEYPEEWVHISTGFDSEVCQQLTAEHLVTVQKKTGFVRREWRKMRDRNEGLDCWCYARAGAVQFGIERFTEAVWVKLEVALGIRDAPAEKMPDPVVDGKPEPDSFRMSSSVQKDTRQKKASPYAGRRGSLWDKRR